jgi:hypothetical protein
MPRLQNGLNGRQLRRLVVLCQLEETWGVRHSRFSQKPGRRLWVLPSLPRQELFGRRMFLLQSLRLLQQCPSECRCVGFLIARQESTSPQVPSLCRDLRRRQGFLCLPPASSGQLTTRCLSRSTGTPPMSISRTFPISSTRKTSIACLPPTACSTRSWHGPRA